MDQSVFFPQVTGVSLAGERLEFPASFGADRTLAVIAFWEWQQPMVDSWLGTARRLEFQQPAFEYFEMPVIEASTPDDHRFIDNGMRSAITDRRAREKTIPLYVDTAGFLRSLGLPTEDEIYAVLLGESGLILRIWAGSATPTASGQLEDLVDTAAALPFGSSLDGPIGASIYTPT